MRDLLLTIVSSKIGHASSLSYFPTNGFTSAHKSLDVNLLSAGMRVILSCDKTPSDKFDKPVAVTCPKLLVGCAMEVHKILGNGFQEVIYQRALAKELASLGITFRREFEMPVLYKDEQIGTRRVDFLVDNVVLVELKAIIQLEAVHLVQAINYLEAYNLEIGLLINFGAKSLQLKRLINSKFNTTTQH